jgi:hypothetical protein
MQIVQGAGCWPGQAEGRVVWVGFSGAGRAGDAGALGGVAEPVADRAAEVLRLRAAMGAALADLERWLERQPAVEGRLLIQSYRDAAQEDAWSRRACSLIDGQGLPAPAAAVAAAGTVAAVLEQTEELHGRAEALRAVARWVAGRLAESPGWPVDAILAAADLSPLELLDLERPVIMAGGQPPVAGEGVLVWGVPRLGPAWEGRRVVIDGSTLTLDPPDPRWWHLDGNTLGGCQVCYLNGDLEAIARISRKTGELPVVVLSRLDDLAAVPLFLRETAAVAVDLDRMGPAPRLKHAGVQLLFKAAAEAARAAGVPFMAGGEPVEKHPDTWLSFGFTALFTRSPARGGGQRALRRNALGGL